jgi:hypothetical protein
MMLSVKRQTLLALLMLLLLSHVALSLHNATHSPVEQTSCELCAGQGSLALAASPALALLSPLVAFESLSVLYEAAVPVAAIHSYRERAPPVSV